MALTQEEKIDALYSKFIGGVEVAASLVAWHRDRGPEPAPGETAIDNPTRAKQFAARGLKVTGEAGLLEPDLSYALDLADSWVAPTGTAAAAEAQMKGCINSTRDSAIYQMLTGSFRNALKPGMGGRPELMYPGRAFEDLIHAPGDPTASVTK